MDRARVSRCFDRIRCHFPPDVPNDEPLISLESLLGYYDEAFVRKAYITLLRRHPDPGSINPLVISYNKAGLLDRRGYPRVRRGEKCRTSHSGCRRRHWKCKARALSSGKIVKAASPWQIKRENEIDMLAGRTGQQLTSRGGAHDAAVARVTDLQATLQEISGILGHHSVPALAPPIPIARAEGDIMPVVQRMSPIRRATDRCMFLLVGLYGRFRHDLFRDSPALAGLGSAESGARGGVGHCRAQAPHRR